LLGDATKAKKVLGWEPKVTFKELAKMMVDEDMKMAEQEKVWKEHKEGKNNHE
jgi:GDPmannose 4,6-dehydratase